MWLEDWAATEALLGGAGALDALAFSTGAMVRRRDVRDGSQLLRVALGYAATGQSLRTTAAWSDAALGVDLSDPALIGRLSRCGEFLSALVSQLLASGAPVGEPAAAWEGPPIRLVDGSVFTGPGKKGVGHRLHAAYDPARGWFTHFDLTRLDAGENLTRCDIEAGSIAVGDRNYARTWALREVAEREAFFCVRAGASSVSMIEAATQEKLTAITLVDRLGDRESLDIPVILSEAKGKKKQPLSARLIVIRASQATQQREQARIERSKSKQGVTPRPDTYAMAKVMLILTNLPEQDWPIGNLHALYRLRWQIELAFKTLKSVFAMRNVPSKTPQMARTWILANLAAALLADRLLNAFQGDIPPSE